MTVPGPVPELPAVIVIHESLLTAVQEQVLEEGVTWISCRCCLKKQMYCSEGEKLAVHARSVHTATAES